MIFSSITFLYLFLPIVLCVYFVLPKKLRNFWLFVTSLAFYFFGERALTSLLLFSSVADYILGLIIEANRDKKAIMRLCLVISMCVNIGLLGYFKYADFFIGNVNTIFGTSLPLTNVALPIGISFYTFQTMSYTIDVYRGTAHAQKNFISFGAFVSLFPQLVAGPIVRYTDIAREIDDRKSTFSMASEGIVRFAIGLGKKVLLANGIGALCEQFELADEKSVILYWACAIGYMLQVYLDFSAYSDMAIGIGKILGFKFPENFNYPFISRSISEFWRRWHMTLGGWFRDYVYFPLGGSRVSRLRWVFNLAVVWALTGFWHGAEWNFVLWGVYFGVLIALEKLFLGKYIEKLPKALQHIYVILIVLVSFVIFRHEKVSVSAGFIKSLFGFGNVPFINQSSIYILRSFGVLFVISIVASMPFVKQFVLNLQKNRKYADVIEVLKPICVAVMFVLCTAKLINGSFNPFLYFRF